jgi:hypothetical protein
MNLMPIIIVGQVYLHSAYNEYLVVRKYYRGDVFFAGTGFVGKHDIENFIERVNPVDPEDLSQEEKDVLKSFLCSDTTELLVGWFESDED